MVPRLLCQAVSSYDEGALELVSRVGFQCNDRGTSPSLHDSFHVELVDFSLGYCGFTTLGVLVHFMLSYHWHRLCQVVTGGPLLACLPPSMAGCEPIGREQLAALGFHLPACLLPPPSQVIHSTFHLFSSEVSVSLPLSFPFFSFSFSFSLSLSLARHRLHITPQARTSAVPMGLL